MKHITSFLLAVALLVSSITLMPSNNVKAARNVPLRLPVQTKWQRWLMGRFRLTKTYVKTAAAVLENVRSIPLRTALTAIRYT
mgnify:CR=1 FL=1